MVPTGVDPPSGSLSPEDQLSETVSRLTRSWLRIGKEEARHLGLSLPQLFLVGGLRDLGAVPVSRWAETMGASPSAMTGLLDGLEADGYIVRVHDEEDRRQVLISLTPRGRTLAARLKEEFRRKWKGFCAGLPGEELEAAAVTLEQIVERMGPVPGLPDRPPEVLRKSRARAQ